MNGNLLVQQYHYFSNPFFQLIFFMTPTLVCLLLLFLFSSFLPLFHLQRIEKCGEKVGMCVCACVSKNISIKTQTSCQCHSAEKAVRTEEKARERDAIERMTKHVWLLVCTCVSAYSAAVRRVCMKSCSLLLVPCHSSALI